MDSSAISGKGSALIRCVEGQRNVGTRRNGEALGDESGVGFGARGESNATLFTLINSAS